MIHHRKLLPPWPVDIKVCRTDYCSGYGMDDIRVVVTVMSYRPVSRSPMITPQMEILVLITILCMFWFGDYSVGHIRFNRNQSQSWSRRGHKSRPIPPSSSHGLYTFVSMLLNKYHNSTIILYDIVLND